MSSLTLLDLAKRSGSDAVVGLIEEVQAAAPEFAVIPARTIKGTSYKTLLRTGLPSVGFRSLNAGVTPSKSTFAEKLVQCFILGGRIEIDKAYSDASEDGPESVETTESEGVMRSSLIYGGNQTYYGIGNDALGFPGFQAMVDAARTIDATGSTANTGGSIYAARLGAQGVQYVFGNNQSFTLSPFRDETITDANGKKLPGRVADLSSWAGLQCVSTNAVGRVKNLTAQSGKGATDTLIATLIASFPVGMKPDRLFMSRRSALQLQLSRSVTIFTSAGSKADGAVQATAPMPTESNGVPITVTDSILDTEAIS